MNLFFEVILSGMAVAFITELVSTLLERFIAPRVVKNVLTLPLAFLSLYLFNVLGYSLVIGAFAAAFFSTAALYMLTSRTNVANVITRR